MFGFDISETKVNFSNTTSWLIAVNLTCVKWFWPAVIPEAPTDLFVLSFSFFFWVFTTQLFWDQLPPLSLHLFPPTNLLLFQFQTVGMDKLPGLSITNVHRCREDFLFFPAMWRWELGLKLKDAKPYNRDIMYTNVANGLMPVLPAVDESSPYFMRLNHVVMNLLHCTFRLWNKGLLCL